MSIGSPTAFLLWSILSVLFQIFLFYHLWCYDKFQCLRWDSGRQPGAFKRVMTYSYLISLPLIVVFDVVITVLKFKEGFIQTPDGLIIIRPYEMWSPESVRWVLPLYFLFSIGWSLEVVTHLEELTFWLFLLHQGQRQRRWFHSWEFRTWYLGSMVAVLGIPIMAMANRNDLDICLAMIMLVGSSTSTLVTIAFFYVLRHFPDFIRQVKSGGAEPDVVVRLATFYQLNVIRVIFRYLFTLPLFILGLDGIRKGSHLIVRDPFWSDFLLLLSSVGCVVSSAITLHIFFPRSMTRESGYEANANGHRSISPEKTTSVAMYPPKSFVSHSPHLSHTDRALTAFRDQDTSPEPTPDYESAYGTPRPPMSMPAFLRKGSQDGVWNGQIAIREPPAAFPYPDAAYSHHRQLKGAPVSERSTSLDSGLHRPPSQLHPYVTNFTSPIDLPDEYDEASPRAK